MGFCRGFFSARKELHGPLDLNNIPYETPQKYLIFYKNFWLQSEKSECVLFNFYPCP